MQRGVVRKWDDDRGYGFIALEGSRDEMFVHYTGIESDDERKTLKTGQSVTFEVEIGPKDKPQACQVRVVER